MTKSLCKKKRNWLKLFYNGCRSFTEKIVLWWKWKLDRWKNHSVIGSEISANNHGQRLRETGGRSPKVWDGERPMFTSPQYLENVFYTLYILSEWFIHSFILETYIAPLQDTSRPTQRRSQPSHRQRRRTWGIGIILRSASEGSVTVFLHFRESTFQKMKLLLKGHQRWILGGKWTFWSIRQRNDFWSSKPKSKSPPI